MVKVMILRGANEAALLSCSNCGLTFFYVFHDMAFTPNI